MKLIGTHGYSLKMKIFQKIMIQFVRPLIFLADLNDLINEYNYGF